MQDALLQQGLTLMLIGMCTVFVFLTTLVAAIKLMSRLAARLPGQAESPPATDSGPEIAAIAAALRMHRRR